MTKNNIVIKQLWQSIQDDVFVLHMTLLLELYIVHLLTYTYVYTSGEVKDSY